ncbi:hypothetical protein AGLY_015215 [Aphis glycines]|uniref:Uncharacterized protein n=1 Tax=Aphis glycines TaxID=307491 RepID=A0A6G0T1U7_APHGL|nr:hypothetical protein AGLY_015215 [Aphis glycines]
MQTPIASLDAVGALGQDEHLPTIVNSNRKSYHELKKKPNVKYSIPKLNLLVMEYLLIVKNNRNNSKLRHAISNNLMSLSDLYNCTKDIHFAIRNPPLKFEIEALFRPVMLYRQKKHTSLINDSVRSDECIDFTMIITSRNNASISNFGGGFRWKSEYPWCIIEFEFIRNMSKLRKFANISSNCSLFSKLSSSGHMSLKLEIMLFENSHLLSDCKISRAPSSFRNNPVITTMPRQLIHVHENVRSDIAVETSRSAEKVGVRLTHTTARLYKNYNTLTIPQG